MKKHDEEATREKKRFRKWDGETPYATHPIGCALLILTESNLSRDDRMLAAETLALHDILEDTSSPLPPETTPRIRQLVQDMSYKDMADEMLNIWQKTPFIRLLKLYDKTWNLLDGQWFSKATRTTYIDYTRRLLADAQNHYNGLNIFAIAHAVCNLRESELT